MSRAAVARLEVLLARVEARAKEPRAPRARLALAPEPAAASPAPVPVAVVVAPAPAPVAVLPAPAAAAVAPAPAPLARALTPARPPDSVRERPGPVVVASAAPVMVPSDVPTVAPRAIHIAEALHAAVDAPPSDLFDTLETTPPPAATPERFEQAALPKAEAVRVVPPAAPQRPTSFEGMLRRSLALRPHKR